MKTRILFLQFVDGDNFDAGSLNAREIMLRLDPQRFQSGAFYQRDPDSRLVGLPQVTLHRVPSRLGSLAMLLAAFHYDILFVRSFELRLFDLFFRLPRQVRRKIRLVQWLEGALKPNLDLIDPRTRDRYLHFTRLSDCRVAITEFVRRTAVSDYGIASACTIPVGVDTTLFRPAVTADLRPDPPARKIRVLFVGHLIARKGPQHVLELARDFPDVEFRLVGAPRAGYDRVLRATIAEQGLQNVELVGQVDVETLAEIIRQSDILLHPSRVEGMPKVTLEAAACGVPSIVFDAYETPTVVDGVTGYQVATLDQMRERLRALVADTPLRRRLGAAARVLAATLDWDVVTIQWQDCLDSVMMSEGAGATRPSRASRTR